jgi:hypothetical protein
MEYRESSVELALWHYQPCDLVTQKSKNRRLSSGEVMLATVDVNRPAGITTCFHWLTFCFRNPRN